MVQRDISKSEIMHAGSDAEIVEDYPDDKYYPSCLLLGFTDVARPLHLHVSRADGDSVRIITLYEPNSQEWRNNYRERIE
jgi:hypothetical protein